MKQRNTKHVLWRRYLACCLLAVVSLPVMADLTANGEYYIWLNVYEKLLGSNEAGDGPALSAYGVKSDGYVFVAESSGKSGYVLLKQKSTGKYLAASSSNSYSVLLESSKSTDDRYCWKTDEGTYVYLVNKKNSKYLGVDGANKSKSYVNVYYDKAKGTHSQFSVVPATGADWAATRQAYQSAVYTNAQGVSEIDYCQLNNKMISRTDAVDIHITANSDPILGNSSVNLGSDRTWLIFDNITPSDVKSNYLKFVTINGAAAKAGTNCRVAIYLNGAAVIPLPATPMTCTGSNGGFSLAAGNNKDLGENSNMMQSFTLRRGYMATVASGTNGSGYSRVYVADHADLQVTVPTALDKRVSSVNIKPWQYLSKKGWADTGGTTKGPQLRATWYWSWSAGYSSTDNMEYVPCRQHRYWPGKDEVNNKTATASLSLNEPEHSEQHTSDKCSCGGTIDAWTAYTINADFMAGGGRVGSPQPTDFSYLTEYCKNVDNMASRCDFVVTHAYWGVSSRSATDYANWFVGQCQTIKNNTGRPVWITELEIGASWSNLQFTGTYDEYAKYLQTLLEKIDECDYIERYAIYSFDYYKSKMFYDDGGITPAGQVYRDHRATFAYHSNNTKVPNWWTPSVKKPTVDYSMNSAEGTVTFIIGNTNGDATATLKLERKAAGSSSWQTMTTLTRRQDFDKTNLEYTTSLSSINRTGDSYRVTATTIYGTEATSDEMLMDYLRNPNIIANSKSDVPGWTCQRSAPNGYTKGDSGDTYFEVWGSSVFDMAFDYYQDVDGLPNGVYQIEAVCFNSSNKVSGASVNGNVGLYAQSGRVEYFAPVTVDSEIDYNRKTTIDRVLVRDGHLRLGIKNQGPMTARWAGADNFALKYLGTEEDVLGEGAEDFVVEAQYTRRSQYMQLFTDLDGVKKDASVLIANTDCNRNDYYKWTVSNLGTNNGQAWDGNNDNKYWDKWDGKALKSSMEQTIEWMPAGKYTFAMLARCTSGKTIKVKAEHYGVNGDKSVEKTLTGVGDQTVSGSSYQRGWQLVTLPELTIDDGDQVKLSLSIDESGTTWWSVDHFTLTWSERPDVVGIRTVESSSQRRVSDAVYNLQGQRVATARGGVYIRNGKKYLK